MSAKRPTILCLINFAAYCRTYFEQFAQHLEAQGFDVAFVLDSHYSDIVYSDGTSLPNSFYFTDFCRSQLPLSNRQERRSTGHWKPLFSDFDRYITMNIPTPLKSSESVEYADIPFLLEEFFVDVFNHSDPVAIIYEQVSNSFAMAANDVAQRRGVPFLSIAPARISGRVEISPTGALRDHETLGRIWERVKREGARPDAVGIAKHFIANIEDQIPDYMKPGGAGEVIARVGLLGKYARIDKFKHIWRVLQYRRLHRDDWRIAYQHGDPWRISTSLFMRSLRRRLRHSRVIKFYKAAPATKSYFLYPLHFHPEASTSVLAPDFVDELSVIKAIAFRLPTNIILAVKEHPSAVALPPLDFYRQLTGLPNVILISPDANSKKLAKDGIGVICLASTLGFEAAALNKPVICLGDVLFGFFPNVRMIEDYGDLTAALQWAIDYRPLNSDEIVSAMSAYVEYTEPGSFGFEECLGDSPSMENIAQIVANTLGESSFEPNFEAQATV